MEDDTKQQNIDVGQEISKPVTKAALKNPAVRWAIVGLIALSVSIFILFTSAITVLGFFEEDDSSSGKGLASSTECGFTISKTSLSKADYKDKIETYATSHPNFKIFSNNANAIYDLAVSKNVNPELVVIRAQAEGQGKETGSNNYWGLGCTNESQGAGCYSWNSFEEGYTYFIDVVAKYDSLASMMGKYAYIGDYWYTLDTAMPSGDGGCYYAPYIYTDLTMPEHVKKACAANAPSCVMNGSTANCTKTTEADQQAYATWQVKQNMGSIRKTIFGLEYEEGPCASTYNGSLTTLTEYNLYHANLTKLNKTFTEEEINTMNTFINSEVDKAGYGTGSGVAAAAQTLVDTLDQQGYFLGYYWGGDRSSLGIGKSWGAKRGIAFTRGGNPTGPEFGMDCSGFVSWAIRMGCNSGYGSKVASEYSNVGTSLSSLSEAKPGDLLANSGHVIMIVKNNGDGTVIAAEESFSQDGLVFSKYTNTGSYSLRDMSDWYRRYCKSSR